MLHFRKRSADKQKDVEGRGMKDEPDGASWTNPVIETEEVMDGTDNHDDYHKKDIHTQEEETADPEEEEKEEGGGGAVITHVDGAAERVNQGYEEDQTLSTFHPLPLPEEVIPAVVEEGDEDEEEVGEDFVEEVDDQDQSEEPEEVKPDSPVEQEVDRDPPVEEFPEVPGYARVGEVSRIEESEEQPPPSKKVGKLTDRISLFEDKYNESSLIRSSRKQELEGIKSRVVTNLVTEYESSDSILLGRQMSDDPAMFLSHKGASNKPLAGSLERNSSFKNQGINNNNNGLGQVAESSEDAAYRHSYLDADTGEPLYSQPDLTKKLSRKSNRGSSKVSFAEDASSIDGNLDSPGLPPKAPEI